MGSSRCSSVTTSSALNAKGASACTTPKFLAISYVHVYHWRLRKLTVFYRRLRNLTTPSSSHSASLALVWS